jgi:hypothetical protein
MLGVRINLTKQAHMKTPRINESIRRTSILVILVSIVIIASSVLAGKASADGYMTPGEESLASEMSGDLCAYLDRNGVNTSSLGTVFEAIYPRPEISDYGDVADVVNYAVYNFCPKFWPQLVAYGEGARL